MTPTIYVVHQKILDFRYKTTRHYGDADGSQKLPNITVNLPALYRCHTLSANRPARHSAPTSEHLRLKIIPGTDKGKGKNGTTAKYSENQLYCNKFYNQESSALLPSPLSLLYILWGKCGLILLSYGFTCNTV